ncbi:hypothetical protein AAKU55_003509 [Oxalobacteraceae bacterium GrIS 1.11]
MLRITGFIVLYLVSSCGAAMNFAGLSHDIHFQPHSARISATEVRSFIAWQDEKNSEFHGGEYAAFLIKNTTMGVGDALVKERADAVVRLMNNLGVQAEVSVEEHFNRLIYQQLLDRLNCAVVVVQPPCTKTNNCGPQPNK